MVCNSLFFQIVTYRGRPTRARSSNIAGSHPPTEMYYLELLWNVHGIIAMRFIISINQLMWFVNAHYCTGWTQPIKRNCDDVFVNNHETVSVSTFQFNAVFKCQIGDCIIILIIQANTVLIFVGIRGLFARPQTMKKYLLEFGFVYRLKIHLMWLHIVRPCRLLHPITACPMVQLKLFYLKPVNFLSVNKVVS